MEKLQGLGRITSLQPPYSLVRRDVETAQLPWCRHENVGVIVYSPMGSGLLTGAMSRERIAALAKTDWRARNEQFREPKGFPSYGVGNCRTTGPIEEGALLPVLF
jgi:aryl-alcohol dehydrogenase-like predicted oxidoreductase